MLINKHLYLLILLSFFSSCAKTMYLTKQASGQIALEWNGIDNEQVLSDSSVSDEHKRKIKLIQKYKNYFYKYFKKEKTSIYDETTFLKTKAVTYLVIASPKDKIKPIIFNFPIVGSFPYIGFFDLDDAKEFQNDRSEEGLSTYIRPVYAYSTLNKLPFYDNILSSFFYYDDEKLAELIFHELTHTIFFIEDEISLNESLAEVISKYMVYEYFHKSELEISKIKNSYTRMKKISKKITSLTHQLSDEYKKSEDFEKTLKLFIEQKFRPEISTQCKELQIPKCWPLKGEWNNARFSAFLTYQKNQNLFENIKVQKNLSVKALLSYIVEEYKQYKDKDLDHTFKVYLEKK